MKLHYIPSLQFYQLLLLSMIHTIYCDFTTSKSRMVNIYLESLEINPDEHLYTQNFQNEINKINQKMINQKSVSKDDLNLTVHYIPTYPYKHQYLIQDDVSNCINIPNQSNFRYTIQPSTGNLNSTFNNYVVLHPISADYYCLRLSVDEKSSFHFIDSIMNWYYPEINSGKQNINSLTLFSALNDLTSSKTFVENCEYTITNSEHTSTFEIFSKRIGSEIDVEQRIPILSVLFQHNNDYQQWFSNACYAIKHHPDPLRGLLSSIEYLLFITGDQSYYNQHISISFYGRPIWGNKNKKISYSFSDQILSTCDLEEGYAQLTLELTFEE
ncbi:hypothetical protein N9N03_01470 [Chlamydiia bacterium]|jgi:hypothetical protein|nr:hypothetical protein [Chlamydiia bacterium]